MAKEITKEDELRTLMHEHVNTLTNKIREIINCNNAVYSDLEGIRCESATRLATMGVIWRFSINYSEDKIMGKEYIGEICSSLTDLDDKTNRIEYKVENNFKIRAPFIEKINKLDNKGFLEATKTHLIKDYGEFSSIDTCSSCNGRGEHRCNSCNGRGEHRCNSCRGTGYTNVTRYNSYMKKNEILQERCYSCSGRGNTSCHTCNGKGKHFCNSCDGHGDITTIRNITAIAQAKYEIVGYDFFNGKKFEDYINKYDISYLNEAFDFYCYELIDSSTSPNDVEVFMYHTKTVDLKFDFKVKENNYTILTFGDTIPIPYFKPLIFDDLFKKEIEEINNNKDKFMRKSKALEYFKHYNSLPALDEAIKKIALKSKNKDSNKNDNSTLILDACQGYISNKAATSISKHITIFMSKLSPSYSISVLIFGYLLMFIFGLVFTEFTFESYNTRYLSSPIENYLKFGIVIAGIVFITNWIVVSLKRKKIPIEYRHKIKHKELMKNFGFGSILIFILSLTSGIVINEYNFPKTNGVPQAYLLKSINDSCAFLKKKNYDICEKSGFNKVVLNMPILLKIPMYHPEFNYINEKRVKYMNIYTR